MCLIIVCIKVTNSWNHSLRHPGCDRGGGLKTKNFKCRLTDWKPPTRKFWWYQFAYYLWCIRSQTSETVLCSSLAVGGGGVDLGKPNFKIGLSQHRWTPCFSPKTSNRVCKPKICFLGSRTRDPCVLGLPSFRTGVLDTKKLVSKSDSVTPICCERTPNTTWRGKKKLAFAGGHEPVAEGYPLLGQGSQIHKNWFSNQIPPTQLDRKGNPTRCVWQKQNFPLRDTKRTPGYPVFGPGSQIHDKWFQNRIQLPQIAWNEHPTRHGLKEIKKIVGGTDPWSLDTRFIDTDWFQNRNQKPQFGVPDPRMIPGYHVLGQRSCVRNWRNLFVKAWPSGLRRQPSDLKVGRSSPTGVTWT